MNTQNIKELIDNKDINWEEITDAHDLYDTLNYDGSIDELIDSYIDIYYYDLRKWAVDNYAYIDDAIEEGLCESADFHKQIQMGQWIYYNQLANILIEQVFDEREVV